MANLSCVYTLNCGGGGTVQFNSGTLWINDVYWLSAVRGLDGPTGRVPFDNVPFGDGGLIHRSFKGPRRPRFEGDLIVGQDAWGSADCDDRLYDLEAALNAALDSILAPTSGSLSWDPGTGSVSLTVFYDAQDAPLDIQPGNGFATRSFSFGLISAAPDPA